MANKNRVPLFSSVSKWTIGIIYAIAAVIVYFTRMPITFRFYAMPLTVWLATLVSFLLVWWFSSIEDDPNDHSTKHWGFVTIAVSVIFFVGLVSSMKMTNINANINIIDVNEVGLEDAANLDTIEYSLVDMHTAQNLGDRKITEAENSTIYEVDKEYNLIRYKGGYYRISSLDFGGTFKALKGRKRGVPGYVLVNSENTEARYVQLPSAMKYTPNGSFGHGLKLHLWLQYPTKVLGKSFFEIDEEGNPWYVTSVTTPIGGMWGAQKVSSFIITDPVSGDSKEYTQEELPDWVDHAYPLDYIMEAVERKYRYVNGWWNPTSDGVFKLSYDWAGTEPNFAGYNTVVGSDGEIYFNTVKTPANKAEAAEGFIYANVRTGEVKYFDVKGAEESTAQNNAQGLVQELGYRAVFPMCVNIDGNPAYFMPMVDAALMVQRYAVASYVDPQKVVQADSVDKVVRLYRAKLRETASTVDMVAYEEGIICSLDRIEEDGNTEVLFTIEGSSNRYLVTLKDTFEPIFWNVGDEVKFLPVDEYHGIIIVEAK